ncbi:FMN-binding glutamate synthase family protein [Oceanicaulis sp.]|uniref:FMN-binding glutamate synthase family protein n=1 Tax=Oceanicaulis sp. TaxID=1924941 RepID=UPI003D26C6C2
MIPSWVLDILGVMAQLFIVLVGVVAALIVLFWLIDSNQRADAVRRNYPVVGRFRSLFIRLGEFFRTYMFALDREELPFNRAEREAVNRMSQGHGNIIPFGSTKLLTPAGTVLFVNCPYPVLEQDVAQTQPCEFGPYADKPYLAPSVFNISGMSYGALSKPAVRALSLGAAKAGIWMNTGEGGVSPMHLEGGGDIVFQIGTAKYGVRDKNGLMSDDKLREIAAHDTVRMFEVKLAQGAKPGKGGLLPGEKVNREIAKIRGIEPFRDSVSPNRHPEIFDNGSLLDFIAHVRSVTGKPTGIKTVIGAYGWLEELCDLIWERGIESAPDFITIDSGDGGTGAAPMPLMDNVGLTVREALPLVCDILIRKGLKDRIRLVVSGKMITPSGVAWALAVGADAVVSARGFMFSIGCIQSLKCDKNTCPTGVTTHKKSLQRGLQPKQKSIKAAEYAQAVIKDVEMIAHSCGVPEPRALKRKHVRVVGADGTTRQLDEIMPYPEVEPRR